MLHPWIPEPSSGVARNADSSEAPQLADVLTPAQATMDLMCFRPTISVPSDLRKLLECRADPNAPFDKGNISPLRKVITFAEEWHVEEMRDLLLQHGARESESDVERWNIRRRADEGERERIKKEEDLENEFNAAPCND